MRPGVQMALGVVAVVAFIVLTALILDGLTTDCYYDHGNYLGSPAVTPRATPDETGLICE